MLRRWILGVALTAAVCLWLFSSYSRWAVLISGALRAMVYRDLNTVEWVVTAAAVLVALIFRKAGKMPARPFSIKGPKGILLVAVLALASRAALLPILPVPDPVVSDEFSFLLQADTFAHGRLTNPTHPMWVHFETIHVFHRPTYQSVYFPSEGIILAVGKLLGHPWIGQWLSGGVMCAALCWMLQGWLPARWAFLASLLAVMRLNLFSYWMNGYWGGFHAAIGGALVLGGLPRVLRRGGSRLGNSLLMALGMVLLASSRPYEGLLLCLPVGWLLLRKRCWRVIVPVTAVLGLGAIGMGYFDWRVSGSPFRTPYQVNRAEYGWPDTAAWLPAPEGATATYRHLPMAQYFRFEQLLRDQFFSPDQVPLMILIKANTIWSFFWGPAMTLPLVMFPRVWCSRRIRFLLAPGALVLVGFALSFLPAPHYVSPMTGIFYAIEGQALRYLWLSARRAMVGAVPAALFVTVVVRALALHVPLPVALSVPMTRSTHSWCCLPPDGRPRAEVQKRLAGDGGKHLVIVRYSPGHSFHDEWVYNEADIDAAKVVWARDMTPAKNQELIRYFPDRHVWLLEPDQKPPRLRLYGKN